MENKVKFYSEDDLSIPFYFKRMEKVFSLYFDSTKKIDNFSDAIELKNAVKIFESGSYSIDWTEEYIARLNSSLDSLKKTYYEFLGRVTFKEISEYMFILREEYEYREDFFEIFSKFKLNFSFFWVFEIITSSPFRVFESHEICLFVWITSYLNP